ncbi:MAG: hypothetical protein MJ151_01920 [Lachnospiraceae bacterium]|nr:hypothetical protein [Lachnospiraceae bacterium]
MKKRLCIIYSLIIALLVIDGAFAATVIKKEDAAQYSKKSDYAQELDTGAVSSGAGLGGNGNGSAGYSTGDDAEKFVCTKATKTGNTYINEWSNYKLTLEGNVKNAIEYYDFNDRDTVYDFGVYWPDWSRLAIYYTRLSRDIDQVAMIYAHNKGTPRNVVIGGEVYRYIQEAIEYPYGTEYYDYYLRNVDGKLMVIECFHENEGDKAPTFIEKIEKYNG